MFYVECVIFYCSEKVLAQKFLMELLFQKTGSQIKIFSNCCPYSTERIVQITGYPKVVVDCVKEICQVISTVNTKVFFPISYGL